MTKGRWESEYSDPKGWAPARETETCPPGLEAAGSASFLSLEERKECGWHVPLESLRFRGSWERSHSLSQGQILVRHPEEKNLINLIPGFHPQLLAHFLAPKRCAMNYVNK